MKYLIIFLCVLCFSQCSLEKKASIFREVPVDVDKCETCSVDSFDYDILPLEDAPNGVIGSIGKMVVTENGYYVSDSRETPALYLFGRDGKFVRKIEKHGRSQKEYMRMCSFTANEKGDTIAVLDNMGREIKLYDQYGHFLLRHVFDEEYGWDDCVIIDNRFYMFSYHGGNEGVVTMYSSDFSKREIIGEECTRPLIPGAGEANVKYIQYNTSSICCMDYFNSCFFLIDRKSNGVIKKYALRSSNMLSSDYIPEKFFSYDQILSYTLVDECLYFELKVKDETAVFKLNFADGKLYKVDTFISFLDYKNNLLYSSMQSEYVKMCMDNDRYFHKNENRLKAFSAYEDKLASQENPFVIINKVAK